MIPFKLTSVYWAAWTYPANLRCSTVNPMSASPQTQLSQDLPQCLRCHNDFHTRWNTCARLQAIWTFCFGGHTHGLSLDHYSKEV